MRHRRLHAQRLPTFSEVKPGNEENEAAFLDTIPDTSPTPDDPVELSDLQHKIQLAIQSLPHTYRPVVWHFYTNQLTYAEIGRILGIPDSTVKTHFNRARPFLPAAFVTP